MKFGFYKTFLNHSYHSKFRDFTIKIRQVIPQARDFHVTTTRKQVVRAALPVQDHWLPLSNLDLLAPPMNITLCLCYKKPLNITNTMAYETIKKSLAESLVSYYPFACDVVNNPTGEPEILCNNRGVDFVEAGADVELRELNLHEPDESIAKLVPIKKHGSLAIQVTQLKCGSIVVGCTFDHRVADGYSMYMFLLSWSEIARSDVPISYTPSFRRSLLNPRRPLITDSSIDKIFMPFTSLPPPQETKNLLTSRIYYIQAEVIEELQSLASCSKNGTKRTKLESLSAFLWKLMAEHAAKDSFPTKTISKLGIVVDGRRRLMKQENNTYFGNVLSLPFGEQRLNDLINKPLSWVTKEVHKFIDKSATEEHFLNLIDWVETNRSSPLVSTIYGNRSSDDGPAFVVSSGRTFSMTQVDFGWGSPVFGSYYIPSGCSVGYVLPMVSPVDNGDWMVYMQLTKEQFKFIEEEASHVFKSIDHNYLEAIDAREGLVAVSL